MRRGKQDEEGYRGVSGTTRRGPRLRDYDFWRALKNLDNEIYCMANNNQPIPIEMIRWRAVIKRARSRRGVN